MKVISNQGEASNLYPGPMCMLGIFRQGPYPEICHYGARLLLTFLDSAADGRLCYGESGLDVYG